MPTMLYRPMTPAEYAEAIEECLGEEVAIEQAYPFMRAGYLPEAAAEAIRNEEEP